MRSKKNEKPEEKMAWQGGMISVIVPVYNKKKYLRDCVDSILAQTYGQIEVLLVDDGSTDGSGEICDAYAAKDSRVRVIHQKNAGPTAACVAGLNSMLGAYCMFVDGDDYIDACTLEEMAKHLAGVPGELVCCGHVVEKQWETRKEPGGLMPGVYEGGRLRREVKARLIGRERKAIPLSRCMKLCERSLFAGNEAYYDYSLRFGDDTNLMYPALLSASRAVILENAYYYHYRYVEGSLVHRYDPELFSQVERLCAALLRAALEKRAPGGRAAVDRERCYLLLYVMKNELRGPEKGCAERIREIFSREEIRALLRNTPLPLRERANRLLYLGLCHPNRAVLMALRMILRIYDRK